MGSRARQQTITVESATVEVETQYVVWQVALAHVVCRGGGGGGEEEGGGGGGGGGEAEEEEGEEGESIETGGVTHSNTAMSAALISRS